MAHDTRDGEWHWGYRLLAGAFGGVVGGIAFGILMTIPAVTSEQFFGPSGMWTRIGELLFGAPGELALGWVWLIHAIASIAFGVLFALIVPPTVSRLVGTGLGMAYGAALWLLGPVLILRLFAGDGFAWDAALLFTLVGHLLYGATLGLVYPAFEHEEERTARGSASMRSVPPRD